MARKPNRKLRFVKVWEQREIEQSRLKAEQAIRQMLVKKGVLKEK